MDERDYNAMNEELNQPSCLGAVMRRAKKLKLYVWEDVLRDYSTGIAFAYAENSIEARKLVLEKLGYNHEDLCGEPREINAKEGFVKHGGG